MPSPPWHERYTDRCHKNAYHTFIRAKVVLASMICGFPIIHKTSIFTQLCPRVELMMQNTPNTQFTGEVPYRWSRLVVDQIPSPMIKAANTTTHLKTRLLREEGLPDISPNILFCWRLPRERVIPSIPIKAYWHTHPRALPNAVPTCLLYVWCVIRSRYTQHERT